MMMILLTVSPTDDVIVVRGFAMASNFQGCDLLFVVMDHDRNGACLACLPLANLPRRDGNGPPRWDTT